MVPIDYCTVCVLHEPITLQSRQAKKRQQLRQIFGHLYCIMYLCITKLTANSYPLHIRAFIISLLFLQRFSSYNFAQRTVYPSKFNYQKFLQCCKTRKVLVVETKYNIFKDLDSKNLYMKTFVCLIIFNRNFSSF